MKVNEKRKKSCPLKINLNKDNESGENLNENTKKKINFNDGLFFFLCVGKYFIAQYILSMVRIENCSFCVEKKHFIFNN